MSEVDDLRSKCAELEASNIVCRRDIEALMSSCDKLEARNTELEAERDKLKAENDELVNNWSSVLAGDLVKAGESEFSAISDPSGESQKQPDIDDIQRRYEKRGTTDPSGE
jgi:chromosome segregation ATPase